MTLRGNDRSSLGEPRRVTKERLTDRPSLATPVLHLRLAALCVPIALAACGQGPERDSVATSRLSAGSTTTVAFTETSEAFPNPMMGFRPSVYIGGSFASHEYTSTYKQYIPYTDLESSATDTVQKIIDWSNANWADLPAQNLKVIPRVVIDYPGTGLYWGDIPNDGTPNEWDTSALKDRLAAFVVKLGQAWDHDPRVAAVEMGLWGYWG
jgi:hypothetical protein